MIPTSRWRSEWTFCRLTTSSIKNQIKSNYFIVRLKVDQRAGQLSLPHLGITKVNVCILLCDFFFSTKNRNPMRNGKSHRSLLGRRSPSNQALTNWPTLDTQWPAARMNAGQRNTKANPLRAAIFSARWKRFHRTADRGRQPRPSVINNNGGLRLCKVLSI